MKKYAVYILIWLFISSFNQVFAEEIKTDLNQGQNQSVFTEGGKIDYGDNNGNNTSIGNLGNNAGGGFTEAPTIPLHYGNMKFQNPNSTPASTIFSVFPEIMNREMIRNYELGMKEQDEKSSFWDKKFSDIHDAILIRPSLFQQKKKSNQLWMIPGIWKGLKENVDYVKIGTATAFSKNELPFKQDLAYALEEWGLDHGANIIVPIFSIDGSEAIFNNKAGGLSGFGSLAQVATSSMFGWAFNPNAGYSSGSNEVKAKCFLGALFLRVDNPETFFAQAKQFFSGDNKESELVAECKKKIGDIDKALFNLTDEKEIGKFKFLRGIYCLSIYQENKSHAFLMSAKDDFESIVGKSENKDLSNECNFYLSAIWTEIGLLQKPGADRNYFWAKAGVHAANSGMPTDTTPPILDKLTFNH